MNATSPPGTSASGSDAGQPCWRFGPARLDERTLELFISDQHVEVERRPLEVLRYLLRHAGEVVTKQELEEAVWPGRMLSDSVLNKCVSRLREVLNDESETIIKTVRGYGYRLVAAVEIEQPKTPPPQPRFDFKPGDSPPLRPSWKFVERLGTGGHGEAWLARHEKTRAQRVYKFAFDEKAVVSLKREITLYRLLHDTLGDRADFVQLLDWNLSEPPYFTEAEYAEGGSLPAWAQTQGGLAGVPLSERLDLVAQIAETLSAAHSVGVLHKDLKPTNVLIAKFDGAPRIKIADFGSGSVLNPIRLDELGITRLGFTKTMSQDASGTLMYLPPEVLAGQPATVQADVYALGVLLYQMVIADFKKPLAPGWEQEVPDELLREDIAQAAHGDVQKRLADAATLAQRLRNLPQRQQRRAQEKAAALRAEEIARALEHLKARRAGFITAIVVLVVGLASTLFLYVQRQHALTQAESARDDAHREAAVSKQITEYVLSMFDAANPDNTGGKPIEARKLVDAGRSELGSFKDQPGLQARLLLVMARLYRSLALPDEARKADEQALELQRRNTESDPLVTAQIFYDQAQTADYDSNWADGERSSRQALAILETHALPKEFDPPVRDVLAMLGDMLRREGKLDESLTALERARILAQSPRGEDTMDSLFALQELSETYSQLGRMNDALNLAQHAVDLVRSSTGTLANNPQVLCNLMLKLMYVNRYREAEKLARQLLDDRIRKSGPDYPEVSIDRGYLADILYNEGRPRESAQIDEEALRGSFGVDNSDIAIGEARLGLSYVGYGDYIKALPYFSAAYKSMKKVYGDDSLEAYRTRAPLGYGLLLAGRLQEALAELQADMPASIKGRKADYWRSCGLIWRAQAQTQLGHYDAAEQDLNRAESLLQSNGEMHHNVSAILAFARARLLLCERRYAEAETVLRPAIDGLQAEQRAKAPDVLDAQVLLAQALSAQHRNEEARAVIRQIEPAMQTELMPTHRARVTLEHLKQQLRAAPA
ncbi:MAG TPA: tetratricopeptide repeat protein [Lacipirellulaceae bacterium]|nr:tetratricopeptide repeat protein [Lacipirellulaceae bacterium]